MLLEIALILQALLGLCAFVGVVRWLVRQINAMKGAVAAQEKTIAAQAESMNAQRNALQGLEALLKNMQMLLESIDEPKMLQRLQAYKAIVDTESKVLLEKQSRHLEERKELMTREHQRLMAGLLKALVDVLAKLFPYVPRDERTGLINSIALPEPFNAEEIREGLRQLAEAAPTGPFATQGLVSLLVVSDAAQVEVSRPPGPLLQPPPPPTKPNS
jgi:TolA-binding protein